MLRSVTLSGKASKAFPTLSKTHSLRRLLNPASIAFIGGNAAEVAILQCRAAGYTGEIWPVNPRRETLGGLACYASIADLPAVPDAGFVAAPPAPSIEIIRQLSGLGTAGAVCFTAGFAETGDQGIELQNRLTEAAGDMAIMGPNCHGFLNYFDDVVLWPDQHGGHSVNKGAALVLQSGNLGINLTMQQRGLDVGYVISVGNKLNRDLHDYIEFLIEDPRVTAIGLHIETISDVSLFSRAAIKALKAGIPIIAIKTGRSSQGAEITMSHTGSLAGSDQLYSALFQRLGIARCETLAEFLETLKFLSITGVLPASTFGSMSCSGGEATLIADHADKLGLEMPKLSKQSRVELLEVLGSGVHLSNPLDYHTYAWGNYEQLNACFSAMLRNEFGCTILVLDYPLSEQRGMENWQVAERALIDAAQATGQYVAIVATLPETLPKSARTRLLAANIAPMQGLEECIFAVKAAAFIGAAQARADNIQPLLHPSIMPGQTQALDEAMSKAELQNAGISIPAGRLCTAQDCAHTADELGYPVVVKAVSNTLAHKTEAQAVKLNLSNGDEVQAAVDGLSPQFDRFLVEKMVSPTVAELIVGVFRDPTFGLTMLIGSGGVLVELLDDSASLLLPLDDQEMLTAIRSLKVAKLIDSYRGACGGDMQTIIAAVESVAAYAIANEKSLLELDINPLIVTPDAAIAADALIVKAVTAAPNKDSTK
ncbi:MAG: acyl-CoA synthetase (NDP forming) [Rhodothermales bacterium]